MVLPLLMPRPVTSCTRQWGWAPGALQRFFSSSLTHTPVSLRACGHNMSGPRTQFPHFPARGAICWVWCVQCLVPVGPSSGSHLRYDSCPQAGLCWQQFCLRGCLGPAGLSTVAEHLLTVRVCLMCPEHAWLHCRSTAGWICMRDSTCP